MRNAVIHFNESKFVYAGLLATVLLVLLSTGPSSFATITESTQPPATTDQSEESEPGIVTVAIGEGSNETIQNYTFTPQTVEINAGDSVTWFSPSEISDIHTVSFRGDPSILPPIILPFAAPGWHSRLNALVPPFNQGEPVIIPSPDGREAIVALNKQTWYPAVIGVNNQTTYLNGTDINVTLNSTLKWVNSGVIVPAMPSTGGAQPNSTESGATGGEQTIGPPFPPVHLLYRNISRAWHVSILLYHPSMDDRSSDGPRTESDWNIRTESDWNIRTESDWNIRTESDWNIRTESDWNIRTESGRGTEPYL